jgi:hypothetical protein
MIRNNDSVSTLFCSSVLHHESCHKWGLTDPCSWHNELCIRLLPNAQSAFLCGIPRKGGRFLYSNKTGGSADCIPHHTLSEQPSCLFLARILGRNSRPEFSPRILRCPRDQPPPASTLAASNRVLQGVPGGAASQDAVVRNGGDYAFARPRQPGRPLALRLAGLGPAPPQAVMLRVRAGHGGHDARAGPAHGAEPSSPWTRSDSERDSESVTPRV